LVETLDAVLAGHASSEIAAEFGVHSATARYRIRWIGEALDKIGVNANDPAQRVALRDAIPAVSVDR